MTSPRRDLRADAARNRELLLAAAQDAFAEHGLDASVADIVERAGVGKGTFFRHFPTKNDVITAIIDHHSTALIAVGEGLLNADDPGEALLAFLLDAGSRKAQRALSSLVPTGHEINDQYDRLIGTISSLLERAQHGGAVRDDITATDVFLLMCAPNHIVGLLPNPSTDLWQRYLTLIFDGLRSDGAHPLPHPAPNLADHAEHQRI